MAWGRMGCTEFGGKNGLKNWKKIGCKSVPVFLVEIFIMWYSLVKLKWMRILRMVTKEFGFKKGHGEIMKKQRKKFFMPWLLAFLVVFVILPKPVFA